MCSVGCLSRSAALVGLWRRRPGGRSSAAGGGGAPAASSERRAAAVVAAQASEEVCGAGGCAATSLGRCQSAAATHSLTASAGARQPLRLLQSTHAFQRRLSLNVYAVSHGTRSPKALVAVQAGPRLLVEANRAHPSRRTRARPGLIGVLWRHRALHHTHRSARLAAARRHTHRTVRQPPTPSPRRL